MPTVGESGTGQETTGAAQFDHQLFTALGTDLVGLLSGDIRLTDFLILTMQQGNEGTPELLDCRNPGLFATGNSIQVLFQFSGEVVVDILAEMFREQLGDHPAGIFREEGAFFQPDIFARHQGVHDTGVSRGTSDAVLFQSFDQTGFGKTGWRLGEMLPGDELLFFQLFPLCQWRQQAFPVFVVSVIGSFNVESHKTGKPDHLTGGAELVALTGGNVDGGRIENRLGHL